MTTMKTRYTVIGAGNGGKAMAAHLALMGFEVTLYNRTFEHIAAIQARGGITLESEDPLGPNGFGPLTCITSDMKVAIENGDIIMVVTPAYAHYDIAREAAPYLQPEQIVILNPGRTLGAIEFDRVLDEVDCANGVTVAETPNFHLCFPRRWPHPGAHFLDQRCCSAGGLTSHRNAPSAGKAGHSLSPIH
jgi:opine dehydrogenase